LAGRYRQRLRGLDALAASMIRIDAMWMWALLVPVKKPVSVCLVWVTQNTLRCPPSEWSTVRHHCGTVSAIAWNTQPSIEPRPRRPLKVLHLWPPKLLHPGHGDLTH
jgi:hypothetical protein